MIVLLDLGHIFWRNWFATKSGVQAYDLTFEKFDWYRSQYARIAVCCDSPVTRRHELAPSYKAQRAPKPVDAIDSLVAIERQMARCGVPVLKAPGFEADDLIATLAAQADELFEEVDVCSNDKDLYQLLSSTCHLVGGPQRVGPAECVEKFGVRPDQMRDWLALVGDAADNIQGCDGVGPGRATDLLAKFGTLEAILAATDAELRAVEGIGPKTLAGLRAWDPALALQLVTLMTDAPVRLAELWEKAA